MEESEKDVHNKMDTGNTNTLNKNKVAIDMQKNEGVNGIPKSKNTEDVEIVIKNENDDLGNIQNDVVVDEEKQIWQDVVIEDEFHGKEKQPKTRLG